MELSTRAHCHARCDECPLGAVHRKAGTFAPVPAELHASARGTVILPAPEKRDAEIGRPLMSNASGIVLIEALEAAHIPRNAFNYTHAVACRYPKDDPEAFYRTLAKENHARARSNLPAIPTPIACCAPRLRSEIADEMNIVACGNEAIRATMPDPKTVEEIRGAPATGLSPAGRGGNPALTAPAKVLPTFAPRTVRRQPRYQPIYAVDFSRALRYFADRLDWKAPNALIKPTVAQLQAFIDARVAEGSPLIYDVETSKRGEFFDALDDELDCIGIGNKRDVVVIPLRSRVTGERFYAAEDEAAIVDLIRGVFTNPRLRKVGHNAGYYDRIVIEQAFGVTPAPLIDTIVLHYLGDSELPHRLGFVGSQYTDVPAWKSEHSATEAENDEELWLYNATDIAVTAAVVGPVRDRAREREQTHLYPKEVAKQNYAANMHRMGAPIDNRRIAYHAVRYTERRTAALTQLRDAWGQSFNPRSVPQLKDLFYTQLDLPVVKVTDTLEPSTDDETLRTWIFSGNIDSQVRECLIALRVFRETDKVINTYLKNFLTRQRPASVQGRTIKGEAGRLGWMHPDYNSASAVTGRYTSQNPNFQNIQSILRDIFCAPDGFSFIDADKDQLELRLAAAIAKATYYIRVLNGEAPFGDGVLYEAHNFTGTLVFGDAYWTIPGAPDDRRKKGSGKFKTLRDLVKRIFYLLQYGGGAGRLLGVVQEAENEFGEPLYPEYFGKDGLAKVTAIRTKLLRAVPEYKQWWQRVVDGYTRDGYVEDPIWGRRRYFANGEDFNAEINFAVQAGGFGIIMDELFALEKLHPFDFAAGTGPVTQTHDSTLLLVRNCDAEQARADTQGCLTSRHLGMSFPAEAKITQRWTPTEDDEWEKDVVNWKAINAALLADAL